MCAPCWAQRGTSALVGRLRAECLGRTRKLEFDFDAIALAGFKFDLPKGKAAELGQATGLGSDNNVKLVENKKKPFFNWISADEKAHAPPLPHMRLCKPRLSRTPCFAGRDCAWWWRRPSAMDACQVAFLPYPWARIPWPLSKTIRNNLFIHAHTVRLTLFHPRAPQRTCSVRQRACLKQPVGYRASPPVAREIEKTPEAA